MSHLSPLPVNLSFTLVLAARNAAMTTTQSAAAIHPASAASPGFMLLCIPILLLCGHGPGSVDPFQSARLQPCAVQGTRDQSSRRAIWSCADSESAQVV